MHCKYLLLRFFLVVFKAFTNTRPIKILKKKKVVKSPKPVRKPGGGMVGFKKKRGLCKAESL